MGSNNSNTLVDEKLAVSLFLDSLLREPEVETETELKTEQATAEVQPAPVVEVKEVEVPIVTPLPIVNPAIVEPVVETKPEVKIQEEVVVETETVIQAEEKKVEPEPVPLVPEWANEPFQILLFEVAGLKLAVPLIELCGVIEWKDSVTEMPGHADFYMGILRHLDYKIAVIDTARMVLPINKQEQLMDEDPRERVNHIVLIDDYKWGLACDKIGEVITLEPDEVRWRTSKTSRGWLAGTVIEHMCALLNSEGFAEMLVKGKNP